MIRKIILFMLAGTTCILNLAYPEMSGTDVFKRAFWKHPTTEDTILHYQYTEPDEKSWQWYIMVKASDQLIGDIIHDNAFSLVRIKFADEDSAPDWFIFDPERVLCLGNRIGNFRVYYDSGKSILYATDKGGMFEPGVPQEEKPVKQVQDGGRLSRVSPPSGKKE